MNCKLQPSLEDFKKFAEQSNLIAVSTNINMDLDTPVSVYYKLVDNDKGFILESVDTTHQAFGRYSFIGAEPFVRLQVFKNKLMIKEGQTSVIENGFWQGTLIYMEIGTGEEIDPNQIVDHRADAVEEFNETFVETGEWESLW